MKSNAQPDLTEHQNQRLSLTVGFYALRRDGRKNKKEFSNGTPPANYDVRKYWEGRTHHRFTTTPPLARESSRAS